MTNHRIAGGIFTTSANTELLFLVPAEHACYADHFLGNPLVPGALLLHWILARIEGEFNCQIVHLKSIKFLAPVRPGDTMKILIVSGASATQLSFNIFVLDTLVIKGNIEFIDTALSHNECVND